MIDNNTFRRNCYHRLILQLYLFISFSLYSLISMSSPPALLKQSTSGWRKILTKKEWMANAHHYQHELRHLIYPTDPKTGQITKHSNYHPIYNFLHRYYRYSIDYISKYSPGPDCLLQDATNDSLHLEYLSSANHHHPHHRDQASQTESTDAIYSSLNVEGLQDSLQQSKGIFRHSNILQNYQILLIAQNKSPFYGCFGFHEWAMLYSGKTKPRGDPHQPQLPLRVSQAIIDTIVETPGNLKCTHFDAWRFFQSESQAWNVYPALSRQDQMKVEQPGCIHANMDLFKYAYQLYPFVSSELLLTALRVAVIARRIDMRASPYDCSKYLSPEEAPICVETAEGRKEYIEQQEKLYELAKGVREELILAYERVIF